MPTRKYEQRLRAETTAQTRQRVLDALAEQLREAPTEPPSMDTVARRADVSRSTIYAAFGSRAGLFDAFVSDLADRTGVADLTAAVAAPDARTHLRGSLLAACRMLAGDDRVYRVLFAMARLDPDAVGGAIDRMEERRRGGMEHLARRLADERVLRAGVSVEGAVDALWMLCSFEAFDLLHQGRGLTVDAAADLLATLAERTLCREAQDAR